MKEAFKLAYFSLKTIGLHVHVIRLFCLYDSCKRSCQILFHYLDSADDLINICFDGFAQLPLCTEDGK